MRKLSLSSEIPLDHSGKRLDQALALLFPEHSRSRIKEWIEKGYVTVNGEIKRPKEKVFGGEQILIEAELEESLGGGSGSWGPEEIPIDVVFEDDDILIINKPAGLVVHPAAGNRKGTLVNALLHYLPSLNQIPRAGIVHRLDKDTTGLMVVAKTIEAHTDLVEKLQARTIKRYYEAVVCGVLPSGGTVETFMGRHPIDRTKMAVLESGKIAITHYRVIERFRNHTHLKVELETGRTHQIRVHMAYLHHPIVGDKVYGGRLRLPPKSSAEFLNAIRTFPRQALHAKSLELTHPKTEELLSFEIPLPQDMQELLALLKKDNSNS